MINDNMIAIPIACVAGNSHGTICGGINRSSLWCGKIKTRVKLYSFIDGVNAIAKAGCNTGKIFIAYWLNGRCGNEELFFIFQKIVNFIIRFFLST